MVKRRTHTAEYVNTYSILAARNIIITRAEMWVMQSSNSSRIPLSTSSHISSRSAKIHIWKNERRQSQAKGRSAALHGQQCDRIESQTIIMGSRRIVLPKQTGLQNSTRNRINSN